MRSRLSAHITRRPRQRRRAQVGAGVLTLVAVLVLAAAALAWLAVTSPRRAETPVLESASLADLDASTSVFAVADAPSSSHEMYAYAVVSEGVHSVEEFFAARENDPIVAQHYGEVLPAALRVERVTEPRPAYMSYRIGDEIYWTTHKMSLHAGENILTDGNTTIRARCGNRLSDTPMTPTSEVEPAAAEFDRHVDPAPLAALPVGPWIPLSEPTAGRQPFTTPGLGGVDLPDAGPQPFAGSGAPFSAAPVAFAGGTDAPDVSSRALDQDTPIPFVSRVPLEEDGGGNPNELPPPFDAQPGGGWPGSTDPFVHSDNPPGLDRRDPFAPPGTWPQENPFAPVPTDYAGESTAPVPVPEPASLTLLATGVGWLALKRIRARRRQR